jgi:hypothetical protein
MASRKLNVSGREWRRLLVTNWGKEGELGGTPWFGEGRFVST